MLTFTFAYKKQVTDMEKDIGRKAMQFMHDKKSHKVYITILLVSSGSNTRMHVLYAKTNAARAQRGNYTCKTEEVTGTYVKY